MRNIPVKKRTGSQAIDLLAPPGHKKKLKPVLPPPQGSTPPRGLKKPDYKEVKTWLTGASQKELDALLNWLLRRKKDASAPAREKRDAGLIHPDSPDSVDRRRKDGASEPPGRTPKISRDISLTDIKEMQEALFPEENSESRPPKMKIADRWDQHTRSVKLTAGKPWERRLGKPPSSDLCERLIAAARSRLQLGIAQ